MKKWITMLALVLLFTASAQAATILMNETFDAAADGVDLDTLTGRVNTVGSGVVRLVTTTVPGDEVEGSTRGFSQDPTSLIGWSSTYSYAVSNVTLGAGEFYRYESFWHVLDDENYSSGAALTQLIHSDGRKIQYYWDAGADLTQDIRNAGGSRINRIRVFPGNPGDIRLRLDVGPDGVIASYDIGSGWVETGQALASDNALFGFAGGITDVTVQLYGFSNVNMAQGDTFNLTVLPEPATLAVLALGGLAVLLRRKR